MLLILEGLDKCGKTTFANKFAKKARIIHSTKYDDSVKVLAQAVRMSQNGKLVILDRSFLSEMCYGPVYRNENKIKPAHIMKITKLLKLTDYCILYFSRPAGEIKAYDSSDEFECNVEKLQQVEKKYEHYIKHYANRFNIYRIQYV